MSRPDVLDLIVDLKACPDLELRSYENKFGLTEEKYLFMDKTLLGVPNSHHNYYRNLEIDLNNKLTFSLVPSLKLYSKFEVPNVALFYESLKRIMENPNGKWTLICERDCSQYPYDYLQYGTKSAKKHRYNLYKFLAGKGSTCLTYIMKSK